MSGDGKVVLTGTYWAAILWDAASGKELRTFRSDFPSRYCSVALSRDGSLVLAGADRSSAILWDAASGKKLQRLWGSGNITCVGLSSDGSQALIGNQNGSTILWKTTDGKKIQEFNGHQNDVCSVALSRDGNHVVTGSWDRTARLWDVASGKMLQSFQGHTRSVTSVALSPRPIDKGGQLWTASEDGTVRLWDPASGKERCRLYSLNAGKDWLVVTPAGLFDSSEGARRFVAYRVPGTLTLVDDDATLRRFHRPGLLARVWKGEL
jgi:WD40 repeat protein